MVLLDGNIPHGITALSPLPGQGSKRGRAPLERFSMIFFSKFKRRKGMLKHGNYTAANGAVWSEEWRPDVLWTEAAELKAEVLRMEQENKGLECSEEDDVEDPQ